MSSKNGKQWLDQKGLTLPELMIAISIVMILSMIGVTSFSNSLPRYRLNATARDLLSDMRLARQLAATNNKEYAIQFLTPTTYSVVTGNQTFIQSSTTISSLLDNNLKDKNNVTARKGVSWTVPATMPLFQPTGLIASWVPSGNTVTAGAPASVVLTDNSAPVNTKTVVLGTSGRIRIQ